MKKIGAVRVMIKCADPILMPQPLRFGFRSPFDDSTKSVSSSVTWDEISSIRRIQTAHGIQRGISREEERFLFRIYGRVINRAAEVKTAMDAEKDLQAKRLLRRELENLEVIRCTITQTILKANEWLVMKWARQYKFAGNDWFRSTDLNDLKQEGNIGVLEAIKRFQPERGCRFSTYASYWVRLMMNCYLYDKELIVRLNAHDRDALGKILAFCNYYYSINYREPEVGEIAAATGIKEKKISALLNAGSRSYPRPGESEDGQEDQFERMSEKDALDSVKQLIIVEMHMLLEVALEGLKPLEREILKRRFGFKDGEEETYPQIAQRHGLDKYAVRYMERKVMRKMLGDLKNMGLEDAEEI